jgi:hypothetical protein
LQDWRDTDPPCQQKDQSVTLLKWEMIAWAGHGQLGAWRFLPNWMFREGQYDASLSQSKEDTIEL